jgi:hypothetical protein
LPCWCTAAGPDAASREPSRIPARLGRDPVGGRSEGARLRGKHRDDRLIGATPGHYPRGRWSRGSRRNWAAKPLVADCDNLPVVS